LARWRGLAIIEGVPRQTKLKCAARRALQVGRRRFSLTGSSCCRSHQQKEVELNMMNGMMDGGPMMWGMGLVSILVLIVLLLAAAALIKYLFFSGQKQDRR